MLDEYDTDYYYYLTQEELVQEEREALTDLGFDPDSLGDF